MLTLGSALNNLIFGSLIFNKFHESDPNIFGPLPVASAESAPVAHH